MTLEKMAGDDEDTIVIEEEVVTGEAADIEVEEVETDDSEDDEIVVTIEGETPSPEDEEAGKAPEWVREVRKKNRELERKLKDAETKLKAVSGAEVQVPALGKKPQLHDDGIDYDADKFEAALEDWHSKKREVEKIEAERTEKEKVSQQAWQSKLETFAQKKADLKVRDYADSEELVTSALSQTQQAIIIDACDNPALVTYALGKSEASLKSLSSITNPVQFVKAIVRFEDNKVKVSNRRPTTEPESRIASSGKSVSAVDKTLERLMAEADKTGNRSKVLAYKRSQKAKK
jgi:hypothetical protein